jgi:signal peptidase
MALTCSFVTLTTAFLGGLLVAAAAGYRGYTVMSGSMEPMIATGDLVVNQPIGPLDARVGDVVTFLDPGGSGRLITHRVQSIEVTPQLVDVVTKGDANTAVERWSVVREGRLGRVVLDVPRVGYALALLRSRVGQVGLVVVPALLLMFLALMKIWQAPPREVSHGAKA